MSQAHEILLIGENFEPSVAMNAEIDTLLGFDAVICGEIAVRSNDGYTLSPNYCEDERVVLSHLNDNYNIFPIVLPASHESSKRSSKSAVRKAKEREGLFVVVFVIGDELYTTKPFESEVYALACVLWFVCAYYQ